jgi:hypothetical protein
MKKAISAIKFMAGFLSNLLCQTARAAANLVSFVLLACHSVVLFALAALQFAGGGRAQSFLSASAAWETALCSAKKGFASLLQALGVVTLLSPLIRGAQACSESMDIKGVIAPLAEDKSFWRDVFGMNSWAELHRDTPLPPPPKTTGKLPKVDEAKAKVSKVVQQKKPQKTKARKKSTEWRSLAEAYLNAHTLDEMNRIRTKMAMKFPAHYARALKEAGRSGRVKSRAA